MSAETADKPFVRQILDVINSVRANPHKIIAAVQEQMNQVDDEHIL